MSEEPARVRFPALANWSDPTRLTVALHWRERNRIIAETRQALNLIDELCHDLMNARFATSIAERALSNARRSTWPIEGSTVDVDGVLFRYDGQDWIRVRDT